MKSAGATREMEEKEIPVTIRKIVLNIEMLKIQRKSFKAFPKTTYLCLRHRIGRMGLG
jgi:hypothetical protein